MSTHPIGSGILQAPRSGAVGGGGGGDVTPSYDCGITDTFTRTRSDGEMGTSEAGIGWTTQHFADDVGVLIDGSRAILTDNVHDTSAATLNLNTPDGDYDATVDVQLDHELVGNVDWDVGFTVEGTFIGVDIFVSWDDGTEKLILYDGLGNNATVPFHMTADVYRIRLASVGFERMVKVWPVSEAEPSIWTATATSTREKTGNNGNNRFRIYLYWVGDDHPESANTLYFDNVDVLGLNRCTGLNEQGTIPETSEGYQCSAWRPILDNSSAWWDSHYWNGTYNPEFGFDSICTWDDGDPCAPIPHDQVNFWQLTDGNTGIKALGQNYYCYSGGFFTGSVKLKVRMGLYAFSAPVDKLIPWSVYQGSWGEGAPNGSGTLVASGLIHGIYTATPSPTQVEFEITPVMIAGEPHYQFFVSTPVPNVPFTEDGWVADQARVSLIITGPAQGTVPLFAACYAS